MDMLQQRAAAARSNPIPNGQARSQPFAAELRTAKVIVNDQERVKLTGTASVVEKRYQMYDMFGPYDEVVDQRAFNDTLARQPDVAYLVNHGGVTMARTTNGTLMLSADSGGLQTEAYVNPKRQDVSDLVTAIEDRDVTEMSFAFRIDEGEWNDEFTEFRILRVDLDRGDVSAVNYGANPYTSVAARQSEVLKDVRLLPAGAQRAALVDLQQRLADAEQETVAADEAAQEARAAAQADVPPTRSLDDIQAALEGPKGRSLKVIQALLDVETAV